MLRLGPAFLRQSFSRPILFTCTGANLRRLRLQIPGGSRAVGSPPVRFNERPVLPRLRRQPRALGRHARRDRRRRRPRRRACQSTRSGKPPSTGTAPSSARTRTPNAAFLEHVLERLRRPLCKSAADRAYADGQKTFRAAVLGRVRPLEVDRGCRGSTTASRHEPFVLACLLPRQPPRLSSRIQADARPDGMAVRARRRAGVPWARAAAAANGGRPTTKQTEVDPCSMDVPLANAISSRLWHRAQGAARRQPAGIREPPLPVPSVRCRRHAAWSSWEPSPRASVASALADHPLHLHRREPRPVARNPASLQLRRHAAQREPCREAAGYVARCLLLRVRLQPGTVRGDTAPIRCPPAGVLALAGFVLHGRGMSAPRWLPAPIGSPEANTLRTSRPRRTAVFDLLAYRE